MASLINVFLIVVLLSVLVPLGVLVMISLLPPGEWSIPPKSPTLDNFVYVFKEFRFYRNMLNTFLFIGLAILISLVLALPTAYAIARLQIKYYVWVFTVVLVILVKSLPPGSLLVPVYELLWKLRLTNTALGVALSYQVYTLPFVIWILTSFLLDLPREVETAARIDGAGRFARLRHIIFPLSIPGIISAVILGFLNLWNEYMYSSVIVSSRNLQTAAVVLGQLVTSEYVYDWGILASANIISVLPAIFFVSFVQKNISKAITGGIKG